MLKVLIAGYDASHKCILDFSRINSQRKTNTVVIKSALVEKYVRLVCLIITKTRDIQDLSEI